MTGAFDRLGVGIVNVVWLLFDNVFWDSKSEYIGMLQSPAGTWIDFIDMQVYAAQPQLGAVFSGDSASAMEAMSDAQIISTVMQTLTRAYGSRVPAQPVEYRISRWGQDPYSKGSHSFYAGMLLFLSALLLQEGFQSCCLCIPLDIHRVLQLEAHRLIVQL